MASIDSTFLPLIYALMAVSILAGELGGFVVETFLTGTCALRLSHLLSSFALGFPQRRVLRGILPGPSCRIRRKVQAQFSLDYASFANQSVIFYHLRLRDCST